MNLYKWITHTYIAFLRIALIVAVNHVLKLTSLAESHAINTMLMSSFMWELTVMCFSAMMSLQICFNRFNKIVGESLDI